MTAAKIKEASTGLLKTDVTTPDSLKDVEIGKKVQGKCLRIISAESPAKLYCCYGVIAVLTVTVLSLSVALSLSGRPVTENSGPCYATCPKDWIGFGNKCYYFSEEMRNWTFSQTSCMALEAHLAIHESQEELNFLKRYKGPSDHWIGLHRESPEDPWMWTDNTEYNNLVLTQGGGEYAYLNDSGISSAKDYIHKKWICRKSKICTSQCPEILNPG
ncbi:C-type lectin domain family 2 member E [Cricetulus griseus]|nr:C-type lectin domain family 2 member E [Cricetulus griseus]XP_007651344.1 C-type lectin domain family 2 member E [Cricetulus griseus]XP_027240461.1 C-type lectin domain family 2 member E [Cricetulus griseus]XP_027285604.1 C-type lectin domain family 2 member E [Cricetulus griseus]XP_027285605.1 C-type lectin domain family 2 member E [Cricetulus griseus]XP_027285606.1 C-type lectin domain family 2 member E [Cricetulus griseus]